MRQWYKTNLAKAILIILAHVMIVMAAVSAMRILAYPVFREEIFEGSNPKTYEDTKSFARVLRSESYQVVWSLAWADNFETDGKYDPDKIVDVEKYYNESKVSGKNDSGLAYRVQDLVDWYNADATEPTYENEQERVERKIIVCKRADGSYQYYRYADFRELIVTGQLSFITTGTYENEDDILRHLENEGYSSTYSIEDFIENDAEGNFKGLQDNEGKILYIDCWNYDGYALPKNAEAYAPIGYDSILQLVNENVNWNGRLSDAIQMVTTVMESFGSNVVSYENVNSGIEEGETNYSYIYADLKNKRIYTNKTAFASFENLEQSMEELKASGKYVIVKPELKDCATNIKSAELMAWKDEITKSGPQGTDFVFMAGVNTDYPVQDSFYSDKQMFDKYGTGANATLALGVLGVILFFVCLIWLTMIAGRNTKDDEVHLNWFDRWKTEIAAVLILAVQGAPLFVALLVIGNMTVYYDMASITEYGASEIPYMIAAALGVAFTCAMFLIGYLSLVRRIKAKTMWKNSLLRAVCRFVKMVFDHMHSVWKVVVIFAAFVLAHWIVMLMYWSWGPGVVTITIIPMLFLEAAAFVFLVLKAIGQEKIKEGIKRIAGGELNHKISSDKLAGDQKEIADSINRIGDGLDAAVEKSMKSERLKTDLITNVSHDIKTPLTSIINYVDLLKQENFEDPKVQRYIEVLEQKAQRLKTLTEDVVEASKVSSGNITLECMNINFVEMIQQTSGEFEEKFSARGLTEVLSLPEEEALIYADGRRTWRILENVYNNAAKYAMPGSRVYGDLKVMPQAVVFSLKNVSEQPLNISADELTERFIRGDISRSTEGSGLGLSIAKTLTEIQKGTFELYLDGDLFKVTIAFPRVK